MGSPDTAVTPKTAEVPPPMLEEGTPEADEKEEVVEAKALNVRRVADPPEVKEQMEALEFPLKNIILRKNNVRSGDLPDMTELTNSIKAEGIIEPLIVAPAFDEDGNLIEGKVELISGYRRYYAAKGLEFKTVPVRLLSADEPRRLRVAIIENLQRSDMNPLDKANSIQQMMLSPDTSDQKSISKALGVSPGFVSQHLGLLKLPLKVQEAIRDEKLDLSKARIIGRLSNEDTMLELVKVADEMTVSELQLKVERLVEKEEAKEASAKKRTKKTTSDDSGDDDSDADEDDAKPSRKLTRAEFYEELQLAPLKKEDLRTLLMEYGSKTDNAKSDEKRMEYRLILKGIALAAGVKAK